MPNVYVVKTDGIGNEKWSEHIDKNKSGDRGYFSYKTLMVIISLQATPSHI